MPERFSRGDQVADMLLEILDFRKAAGCFPVKYFLVIQKDLKRTGYFGGPQGDFAQFVGEGGEQFLSQPGRTQQPAAFGAVFEGNPGFHKAGKAGRK